MRIYVLLTSCDPLRVFMYEEGLARFATMPYAEPHHSNLVRASGSPSARRGCPGASPRQGQGEARERLTPLPPGAARPGAVRSGAAGGGGCGVGALKAGKGWPGAVQGETQPPLPPQDEVCMHLTNYAINKHNENFVQDDAVGSKRYALRCFLAAP